MGSSSLTNYPTQITFSHTIHSAPPCFKTEQFPVARLSPLTNYPTQITSPPAPNQSNFPWLGSNVRDNDELRGLFHATLDVDTFDVMVPTSSDSGGGSGSDDTINGSGNGSGSRGSGFDCVKVGVFGVCTQYTPSLADPGDKVASI